jgi:excisionase family DNA binding protein
MISLSPEDASSLSQEQIPAALGLVAQIAVILLTRLMPMSPALAPKNDRLLTAEEVGAILGIPQTRVYELARQHQLPSIRHGGRYVRFTRMDVEDWIAKNRVDGGQYATYSQPRDRARTPTYQKGPRTLPGRIRLTRRGAAELYRSPGARRNRHQGSTGQTDSGRGEGSASNAESREATS